MLKEIITLLSALISSNLVKGKVDVKTILIAIMILAFIYITSVNFINIQAIKPYILNIYRKKECKQVNIEETRVLSKLVSTCNNGKSAQCYISRWCLDNPIKEESTFEARIYQLVTCGKGKENIEFCYNLVLHPKYERPLYITGELLNRNAFLDGDSNCGYITKEEMIKNRYDELLDYSNILLIESNIFTYCVNKYRMTLLVQSKDHSSIKGNDLDRLGCLDKYCLLEVMTLNKKLKKFIKD